MIEGPIQTNNSGLVFYFDTKEPKSYVGEPTTNRNQQISNYTGTNYADGSHGGEWTSNPTRFTKTYNDSIITPIGFGATLCSESGTAGFHHLSSMGGGEESGAHSISCYVKPLNSITDFTIGMLGDGGNQVSFNLSTKAITYGGGISNRNAFCVEVSGFPGWLYVGANIEGRAGGWVGCVGISTSSSYTPTAPYKAFYITGLQYEYKVAPTKFTVGTRSNTQGLLDLTGNSTLNLSTMTTYTNTSGLNWSGNNYITTANNCNLTSDQTLTAWIRPTKSGANTGPHNTVICTDPGYQYGIKLMNYKNNSRYGLWLGFGSSNYEALYAGNINDGVNKMFTGTWTQSTGVVKIYINAQLVSTINTGVTSAISLNTGQIHVGTGYELAWGNGNMFEGDIYAAAIYNRALSDTEILKNFNSQRSRYSV